MRQNKNPIVFISSIFFVVIILILFAGNAIASECIPCHTQKEKLKAITDTLPKKVKSAQTSGQG